MEVVISRMREEFLLASHVINGCLSGRLLSVVC